MRIFDTIVVGAGPAGVSAGNYANRLGLMTLIVYDLFGGQLNYCDTIYSHVAVPKIKATKLIANYQNSIRDVEKFKDTIIEITKTGDLFYLKTQNGNLFITKTVIVCSGAKPKIFKDKFLNFSTYLSYPYDMITPSNKIVIIGGGYIGLEIASFALKMGAKTIIVEKTSSLGGNAERRKEIENSKNLAVFYNTKFIKMDGRKCVLETQKSMRIIENIDHIFLAFGVEPNTSFLNETLVNNHTRALIINRAGNKKNMNMTNTDGLFAAGDVVETPINGFVSFAEGMGMESAKAAYNYLKYVQNNK